MGDDKKDVEADVETSVVCQCLAQVISSNTYNYFVIQPESKGVDYAHCRSNDR